MSAIRAPLIALVAIGLVAGFLSGLFGVGGGIIVIPALLLLGYDQRRAAGTSVAAILPTSIVGSIGYAVVGHIDWLAGIALAVGVVAGAQLGSLLLARLPQTALSWSFLTFLLFSAATLWLSLPSRDDSITVTGWTFFALVGAGVVAGALSGVLGVGGGIIVVPVLMFFFNASDLIAKGTSLAMMIPGSISATLGNLRRTSVDLRGGLCIGIAACAASPAGILTATAITPLLSNIAFSVLLAAIIVPLAVRIRRRR
ncbi:sulfite exporter TauE/SafE family protein [Microbacterium trichothecenolyticum]|uniref:sulfite exporter TauE/SafE family protein n=1 Tax=Microbacterium trichothecenolyticum TaxID=69370 RepID=UPI001C6F118E|nr:sulfite exporter TauE/SafE family protein [Microbacterium trichothecenolyticum]MBW9121930.1 sulfite exporter TauE/SafE family protein [Microbacterium trichothecenolyticum]